MVTEQVTTAPRTFTTTTTKKLPSGREINRLRKLERRVERRLFGRTGEVTPEQSREISAAVREFDQQNKSIPEPKEPESSITPSQQTTTPTTDQTFSTVVSSSPTISQRRTAENIISNRQSAFFDFGDPASNVLRTFSLGKERTRLQERNIPQSRADGLKSDTIATPFFNAVVTSRDQELSVIKDRLELQRARRDALRSVSKVAPATSNRRIRGEIQAASQNILTLEGQANKLFGGVEQTTTRKSIEQETNDLLINQSKAGRLFTSTVKKGSSLLGVKTLNKQDQRDLNRLRREQQRLLTKRQDLNDFSTEAFNLDQKINNLESDITRKENILTRRDEAGKFFDNPRKVGLLTSVGVGVGAASFLASPIIAGSAGASNAALAAGGGSLAIFGGLTAKEFGSIKNRQERQRFLTRTALETGTFTTAALGTTGILTGIKTGVTNAANRVAIKELGIQTATKRLSTNDKIVDVTAIKGEFALKRGFSKPETLTVKGIGTETTVFKPDGAFNLKGIQGLQVSGKNVNANIKVQSVGLGRIQNDFSKAFRLNKVSVQTAAGTKTLRQVQLTKATITEKGPLTRSLSATETLRLSGNRPLSTASPDAIGIGASKDIFRQNLISSSERTVTQTNVKGAGFSTNNNKLLSGVRTRLPKVSTGRTPTSRIRNFVDDLKRPSGSTRQTTTQTSATVSESATPSSVRSVIKDITKPSTPQTSLTKAITQNILKTGSSLPIGSISTRLAITSPQETKEEVKGIGPLLTPVSPSQRIVQVKPTIIQLPIKQEKTISPPTTIQNSSLKLSTALTTKSLTQNPSTPFNPISPIPLIPTTPLTPPAGLSLPAGGLFSSTLSRKNKPKKRKTKTPSLRAIAFGITGTTTPLSIKSGLGTRPIQIKKPRRKTKNAIF